MVIVKKSVPVNDVEIIDTSLIYSCVIAMQLTNEAMTVENIFKYELSPIPTTLFNDEGEMRVANSKSDLKPLLETKVSSRGLAKPDLTVIDGSAILLVVNWPSKALVSDYVGNVCAFMLKKLDIGRTYLVFDCYNDFSTKSSKRTGRGKSASQTHQLTGSSPLSAKTVVLSNRHSKSQLIDLICDELLFISSSRKSRFPLVLTGSADTPMEVNDGLIIERKDLTTTYEEADVIMVQQAYKSALDSATKSICVVCDDTDVFILLVYFYHKLGLDSKVYMQVTSDERDVLDIGPSVINCRNTIPSVLSAHALSGCDTGVPFFWVRQDKHCQQTSQWKRVEVFG